MEKIFQILVVFALLMLIIRWFFRDRELKFRDYIFSHRFRGGIPPEISQRVLTAVVTPLEGAHPARGQVADPVPGQVADPAPVIDTENGLIFRRGREKISALEIADEHTGQIIAAVEIDSVDAILFDPAIRWIFCYGILGLITIIRQSGRGSYRIIQSLAAPVGGTALSFDPRDKKIYIEAEGAHFVFAPS
jgi:hypothetical protein